MRTALYVYAPTTLSITTQEDNLSLSPMDEQSPRVPLNHGGNSLPVGLGIYMVQSHQPIFVSPSGEGSVELETTPDAVAGNKDRWPDPPPRVTNAFGVTNTAVQDFFMSKAVANP